MVVATHNLADFARFDVTLSDRGAREPAACLQVTGQWARSSRWRAG